jgi:hypothetical protein
LREGGGRVREEKSLQDARDREQQFEEEGGQLEQSSFFFSFLHHRLANVLEGKEWNHHEY